jgi:hypothetical protein
VGATYYPSRASLLHKLQGYGVIQLKRILTLTACIVLLTLNSWSQTAPTHEETMISSIYGQLAYLTQVKVASDAALSAIAGTTIDKTQITQQFNQAEVQITLSDFKTGALSDIEGQKWMNFVSPTAPRDTLYIQVGTQQFTDNGQHIEDWRTATARWIPAHVMSPEAIAALRDMTIHQVLIMPENASVFGKNVYTHYTTFTASVTYQGKTMSDKAIAFFGTDPKSQEAFTIQNPVLNFGGSLPSDVNDSFYPKGLMHSRLRDTPILSDWFVSQALSASSCTAVKHTLCCSGSRCGISVTDLQEELSTPLTLTPDKSTN